MGLGLLVAFFAFRKAHSLPGGRAMAAVLVLAGISGYEVFTGHKMMSKAFAIQFTNTVVESITGGSSINVFPADNTGATQYQFQNNTNASITITSVSTDANDRFTAPAGTPQCATNPTLAPSQSCYAAITSSGVQPSSTRPVLAQ